MGSIRTMPRVLRGITMRLGLGSALIALFLWAPMAVAQDYAPFVGHWKGSGISETDNSIFFAVTVRDLDVVVTPIDDQTFELTWTTVTRESGDPDKPKVKKRSATITFRRHGAPGVYRDVNTGDPLKNEPVWWSRVEGGTLFTYQMQIYDDGTWSVQKYTREISADGMALTYQRIADGVPQRQVRGRLIKVAK